MKMMRISLVLILSIFCSSTWARFQRRTTCRDDQFECGPGARNDCIPDRWVCDGDNDCGNGNDEKADMCASRPCPSGEVKCEGSNATRRCIPETWICDGDNDCGNLFDEQSCENRECPSGRRRCPGGGRCIPESYFCDGDNDCGDMSDEAVDECPTLTCRPYEFPCPPGGRRRCISEHWLCDGDDDCGDNSDEDPETCAQSVTYQLRQCKDAMQPCIMSLGEAYEGLRPEELMEKIRNTDLRETCRPVLAAQECAEGVLKSPVCEVVFSASSQLPYQRDTLLMVQVANTTVNFVCRDRVDEMNKHKECLLRADPERDEPAIAYLARRQCEDVADSHPSNHTYCPPQPVIDCVLEVVSEQCGEEAASDLRQLSTKIQQAMQCTKRSKMEKKEKHSGSKWIPASKMMKKEKHSPLEMMREAFASQF